MIERRKTIVETIVETEWKVKPIRRGDWNKGSW
jgi:hypothetical protein